MKRTMKIRLFALIFISLIMTAGNAPCQTPLNIMISNDDGVDSPGITILTEALSKIGNVTVAAPSENKSGCSHGMSMKAPIAVKTTIKNGVTWHTIDALPATCVRMGIDNLLPSKPDIVISGINRGANMGMVTFYSATVACAREAAFQRIPAIAVSLEHGPDMDYKAAAFFIASLVKDIKNMGLRGGTYLNVNIPALPKGKIKGVLIVPLDSRAPLEFYEKGSTSENTTIYMPNYAALPPGEVKTDVWAIKNGYIAISPISIDKNCEEEIRMLQSLEASYRPAAQ